MNKDNYKWWALALLWVAFFLQQGTRQLFGPSVPAMCASFGVGVFCLGIFASGVGIMIYIAFLFDVVPGRVLSAGRPRDSAGAHVFSQEGHRTIRSWR